jgi:hypothetical protein
VQPLVIGSGQIFRTRALRLQGIVANGNPLAVMGKEIIAFVLLFLAADYHVMRFDFSV